MRFRLSLKFLLLAVFLCAVIATFLGKRYQSFQRQQTAVAKLKELGGSIEVHWIKTTTAWYDFPLRLIFDESELTNIGLLVLRDSQTENIGPAHFEQLESLPALKDLNVEMNLYYRPPLSQDEETAMVDQILALPDLKSVTFDTGNISKLSYDRLMEKPGMQIAHLGISDFQLQKNFVRLERNDSPVDLDKSQLSLTINDRGDQITGRLGLYTKSGKYVSRYYEFLHLGIALEIPVETGVTIQNSEPKTFSELVDGYSNFYIGIHCTPCDIRVRLVSNNADSLHLDFDFVAALIEDDFLKPENQERVKVNTELVVKDVCVEFDGEADATVERAERLLQKLGLDPKLYAVDDTNDDANRIEFIRK